MFSTPLICSSIGATTVEATTSAFAPGYWPDTLITGGAISGYCATGRRVKATAPRITITIETTAAKIGRSMKKCEIRMPVRLLSALACGPAGPAGAAPCSCGVTFWPGRTRIRPLTMTRSSAVIPSLMMRRLSSLSGPSVTYFCTAALSSPTTSTNLRICSVPIAASGNSKAL